MSGPVLIAEAAVALWGSHWQGELARALGVSDRTVRRWAAGDAPPPGVYAELLALAEACAAGLRTVTPRLRQAAQEGGEG